MFRRFVQLSLLATVLIPLAMPASVSAATPTESPNIVLIYTDDLGYGDLGVYGHHTIQTPNIDQLAADGLRFTQFYAPSALCSPSRAGLLTGRTPFRTGIQSWIPENTDVQLGPREITLAALLKRQGYETFLGGKWHLNGGLEVTGHTQPEDHGFDHWLALHAYPIPHMRNTANFYRNGEPVGDIEGFSAQYTIDEAIEWLASRNGTKPLFMYLATVEPHSTLAQPDVFNERYGQLTRGTIDPIISGLREPRLEQLEARGPGEYYANITYLDEQLGRFLAALDAEGLRDSTLVIFSSDNGPVTTDWRQWWETNLYGSTGGLRGRKGDLYEGGIRVPGIIRWPGVVEPGTLSDAVVGSIDLLPTLASVAGFPVPDDRPIDGEDFSAILRGEPFERSRPLYWEFDDYQGFHYALRDGDWKLLADQLFERVELYNLAENPLELVDRAAQQPEVVERLLGVVRKMDGEVERDPLRPR